MESLNKKDYKKFIKSKILPEGFKYETDLLVIVDLETFAGDKSERKIFVSE